LAHDWLTEVLVPQTCRAVPEPGRNQQPDGAPATKPTKSSTNRRGENQREAGSFGKELSDDIRSAIQKHRT